MGSTWVKSSLSFSNGNCVEIKRNADGTVSVRHSKNPHCPVLTFTPSEWTAFTGGVKLGEFDLFGQ
jgi:hypothetical protein